MVDIKCDKRRFPNYKLVNFSTGIGNKKPIALFLGQFLARYDMRLRGITNKKDRKQALKHAGPNKDSGGSNGVAPG